MIRKIWPGLVSALTLALLMLLMGCKVHMPEALTEAGDVGECVLTFIAIGKGDAFLLTTPEGGQYLIDTGRTEDYPQIKELLHARDVEKLDGIFLTHGHSDHAGNLGALLNDWPTDCVYVSGQDSVTFTEIDPRLVCSEYRVRRVELLGGETLELGGVKAEVWLPQNVDVINTNNNSMILRLKHGQNRFLMMGDAELQEEAAFCMSGANVRADLLKLGHHGETDATAQAFLDRVKPKIALITGTAKENPDSVDPVMRSRLQARHIDTYVSECEGLAWTFTSDGKTITAGMVEE